MMKNAKNALLLKNILIFSIVILACLKFTFITVYAQESSSEQIIYANKVAYTNQITYEDKASDVGAGINDILKLGIEVELEIRAENYLDNMTLEEKIAQLFLAECRKNEEAYSISKKSPGGIILFSKTFKGKTSEEVIKFIEDLQKNSEYPLIMATDEEGGSVVRMSSNRNLRDRKFESAQELYSQGGKQAIINDTIEKCNFLLKYGINVNMAPVSDISTCKSDYIYERTYGRGPDETSDYVRTVVGIMKKNKLGSVLKHFPGYGNNIDTHKGVSIDERTYDTFVESDFIPFIAGINEGADAVLVSHNIVKCMDDENPASLSKKVHDILRNDLKFNGVIITDDLDMKGITEYTEKSEVAVAAILAGNDFICCGNYNMHYKAVLQAVKDGTISEERIDESVKRILMWKLKLGII